VDLEASKEKVAPRNAVLDGHSSLRLFRSLLSRTSCLMMASVRQLGSGSKNLLKSLLRVILVGRFVTRQPDRFSL
jgi:hypothetical protein